MHICIYMAYRERGSPVAVIILVTGQEACNYIILFAAHTAEDTRHSIPFVCLFLYANEINTTLTRGTNNIIHVPKKSQEGRTGRGRGTAGNAAGCQRKISMAAGAAAGSSHIVCCSCAHLNTYSACTLVCVCGLCVCAHICLVHFFLLLHSPWQIPSHSYPLWQNAIKLL